MFSQRPYQSEAVDYGLSDLGTPILCSPCGSGKSLIALWMAKHYLERGKKVVILTPREEILYQFARFAEQIVGPCQTGIVKSGEPRSPYMPLQICSWPTLRSWARRAAEKKRDLSMVMPQADLVLVDEAHMSVSPQMINLVLPYFQRDSKLVGLTATPATKNGYGLGAVYTSIKHVTSVRTLIKEGNLSPLEYFAGKQVDLSDVRERSGDYVAKDLGNSVNKLVGDYVDNWLRIASGRHTIVFTPDKASCEGVAERYNEAGIRALALHSGKHHEKRHQIVEAFKAQKAQVLVNVGIATFGFDVPSVDCIQILRNTKSIVLHIQMLGRGMRPYESKESCLILDHTANVRELGYADDLFRWRLSGGKAGGATNWTRDVRSGEVKEGEDPKPHECKNCQHLFSMRLDCPKCGLEIIPEKRDLETTDAKLVRISRKRSKDNQDAGLPKGKELFLQLLYVQERRGYSPKWAVSIYKKWHEKGAWPRWGWRDLEAEPASHVVLNKVNRGNKAFHSKRTAMARRANA